MTKYNKWEVWNAYVPYDDKPGGKYRPVVILDDSSLMVLSLKMTSQEPRYDKLEGEYELMKWKEAGLLKPTVVQCSKLLKLDKSAITKKQYGRLNNHRSRIAIAYRAKWSGNGVKGQYAGCP